MREKYPCGYAPVNIGRADPLPITPLPVSSVVDVEGVPVPLLGIDDLIASKRTGRPIDTLDIEVLEEIRRLRREEADG